MADLTFVYEHPPAAVFALLTDPEFLAERSRALGELAVTYRVSADGGRTVIDSTRDVRREVPGFAAKLFSPVSSIHQIETWPDGGEPRRGSFALEVKRAPVTIRAEMTLRAHPRGAEYEIRYDVAVRVPLLGKRLAAFTLEQTRAGALAELRYTADALARRASGG